MITRKQEDLQLKRTSNPIESIEVDIDGLEAEGKVFPYALYDALDKFSKINESSCASIYTFLTQSNNFHRSTYSGFIGVVGDKNALDVLMTYFSSIGGVEVRRSDYISPPQAMLEYHIEDGMVWGGYEPGVWFAEEDLDTVDEELDEIEESNSKDNVGSKVSTENPARFRAARKDATVGSIKAQIESVFGLPEGSVALLSPDGTKIKSNAKIGTLRNRWED